jgi:uncharacterized protein YndB with AHSA1/START domain
MKTAAAEVLINAPVAKVWSVMMNLDSYPEWNPFTPKVECPGGPKVGAPIKLHVRWADGKQIVSPEKIVRIDAPQQQADGRLRGVYGYNFGTILSTLNLVRSERLQIVEEQSDGTTRYRTTIQLTGLLSSRMPMDKIQDGFDRQAAALKAYCER